MTTTFNVGDRVFLVGGSFDHATFGIWTGTVEMSRHGYWVRRDDDGNVYYWIADGMFLDRDDALSYANQRLADRQKALAAQLESANKQYADAVNNCPATLDAPVTA